MSRPQAFASALCVLRRRPLNFASSSLRPPSITSPANANVLPPHFATGPSTPTSSLGLSADFQSARLFSTFRARQTPADASQAPQISMPGLDTPTTTAAVASASVPLDGLYTPRQPSLAVLPPPPPAAIATSSSPKRLARDLSAEPPSPTSRPSPSRRMSHPVQPPSEASGGIPEPTPEYLAQSLLPPTALPEPRRILVILDLNGTILYRPNSKVAPRHYVERPYARAFLRYCLDVFRVVIWSSARTHNVSAMLNSIMDEEMRQNVVAVWSRSHFGLTPYDFANNTQCYKRLTRVWQDPIIAASHPYRDTGGKWNQTNTVLVDDSTEKARAEPYNLLRIPEFSGDDSYLGADVIPQVHDYLNTLAHQADISQYVRQNPFTIGPDAPST